MGRLLLRRSLQALLLVWLVVSLTFLLMELAPGDASQHFLGPGLPSEQAALLRLRWGLDLPIWHRYLVLLHNLLGGDLGQSLVQGRPVAQLLAEAIPSTLLLATPALVLSFALGIPLGAKQAQHAGSRAEGLVGLVGLWLFAMPRFWLGLVLVILLAGMLPLFPALGTHSWNHHELGLLARLLDRLHHLVLPTLALGLPGIAWVARHQRASLLGVLRADYLRTARSLGLSESRVLWRHALPNGLLPVIALAGVSLPFLLAGSVLVETVFAWPGMGRLMVGAVLDRDSPVIMACFLVYGLAVVLGNLSADLTAGRVDPRVREGLVDHG